MLPGARGAVWCVTGVSLPGAKAWAHRDPPAHWSLPRRKRLRPELGPTVSYPSGPLSKSLHNPSFLNPTSATEVFSKKKPHLESRARLQGPGRQAAVWGGGSEETSAWTLFPQALLGPSEARGVCVCGKVGVAAAGIELTGLGARLCWLGQAHPKKGIWGSRGFLDRILHLLGR